MRYMALLVNLLLVTAAMTALWLWSLRTRNVSIVDVFWGLGFVLISWVTLFLSETVEARSWIMASAVTVWGLRLSTHLAVRTAGKPEDYRYAAMRERQGPQFARWSLVWIFGLQGALMWIVSLPVQWAVPSPAPLNWLDAVGVAVWSVGWICESLADWQLQRFKADPAQAGQVLDRGLWRYTRHPNYFGDFLVWWGLFLMGLAAGVAWWTVVSPLIMSVLLMKVSGVALLEKGLHERRPAYADYVRRTSAFFPWPPRRDRQKERLTYLD
ncbi:MAG: DUF1295 domain-containing protein [Pirellulaceae bacterium]|nr:DUF1295 domain-containing protein [Pirellulaceae bacterium]